MSSIVPPQETPGLNNFSFNTIGKEPDLLRRIFSGPAPGPSFRNESRSSSPPPANENTQSTSRSGLFQALVQDSTPDVQMQDSTPARRSNVNIFGQRITTSTLSQTEPTTQHVQQPLFATASSSHVASTSNQPPTKSAFQASRPSPNPQTTTLSQSQTIQPLNPLAASTSGTASAPPIPVHVDIKNRLTKLQTSIASATAFSNTELASALDKIRNAETLAEQSLSASQQVAKVAQASLKASQGARAGVTEAATIVQNAVNEFGKREEQWGKVCNEMKADLIKLSDIFDNLDRRRRERQQEVLKQREREEKERQNHEKEREEEVQRLREEIEKQKTVAASQPSLQGNDIPMHNTSSSQSVSGPSTSQPNGELGMQKFLQDTDARMQEMREMMQQLERKQQEIEEERKRHLEAAEEEERRKQIEEEEKKRKAAEEEEKRRKEEMERKRLQEEEHRHTEENLREDLHKRKEARKSQSAEVEGRQMTPSTQTLQQSSQPALSVVTSNLGPQTRGSAAPVGAHTPAVASLPQLRTVAPLSPSLPPKPMGITAQMIITPTPDSAQEKKKGKGNQKTAKANNTTSGQVRLAPSSTSTSATEGQPNPNRTAGSGPTPTPNGVVPSTPISGSKGPSVQSQSSAAPQGTPNAGVSVNGVSKAAAGNVTAAPRPNGQKAKNKNVKKEPAVVTLPATPAVKKEQLDDVEILQRTNAAPAPAPISRPAYSPKTPATNKVASASVVSSHSTQLAPSPDSIPSPSIPSVTNHQAPHRDPGESNPPSQKRKRAANQNTSISNASPSNAQQAPPVTAVRRDTQPLQAHVDASAALGSVSSLPSLPSLPVAATTTSQTIAATAPASEVAPVQLPARLQSVPTPPPATSDAANAAPSTTNDLTDRLRQSPISPDMQDGGGWGQRPPSYGNDDRDRARPPIRFGLPRPAQNNYTNVRGDHWSPGDSSPPPPRYARMAVRPRSPSPRWSRSPEPYARSPRSRSPGPSRSRSRSPYYRRTPSPNPRSNSGANSNVYGQYRSWRDPSWSPPPRRGQDSYVSRKRPHEDRDRDTYPIHRPYDRSPSPVGGTLESRLLGDREPPRRPKPNSRNTLLRRLRNSNEPDYDGAPQAGHSRRSNGASRGRGRGSGRGGARLAQRINSQPSVQQSRVICLTAYKDNW
ncbi:hypothetical protein D9758_006406 [Tetrapyrgos nigripes]|uniref:Uncharacterized protein n=1 Tax=Tetrapyrgos nigripes TaxID=182062 RepID=A0A8H5DA26_9AGAR|nr:hypothetical protein D9758_006406 [Tetrapyrgos nigripes]